MSNNKQSMKLYTTDQVIDIFEKYGNMSAINARNIIDLSESIELPSDEEISEESYDVFGKESRYHIHILQYKAFKRGALWMRDKIQGGNNE